MSNNDASFEEQALACLEHVERFARALTRDASDADDLVQDTYLQAMRARATFRADATMRPWLLTICKNLFLRQRRRGERDEVSLDEDPTDETRAAALAHGELLLAGDDRLLDRLDVVPAVTRAMATLSPALRTAVVLVDFEGYGYADAALILEVPVGTVRSRLFRARRELQEQLIQVAIDAGIGVSNHPGEDR
ncbi:MAG: RNA polymerase sigma factor [Gemmatimonas sp.]